MIMVYNNLYEKIYYINNPLKLGVYKIKRNSNENKNTYYFITLSEPRINMLIYIIIFIDIKSYKIIDHRVYIVWFPEFNISLSYVITKFFKTFSQ